MEVYLVYKFTYCNCDYHLDEEVEFFGIFKNKQEAINQANAVIKTSKGDFREMKLTVDKKIKNRRNPFKEVDEVLLYDKYDYGIYRINIKPLKIVN